MAGFGAITGIAGLGLSEYDKLDKVFSENVTGGGQKSTFELPTKWRSAKGVEGKFSDGKHSYRIDTLDVAPEESFHVHVYDPKGNEIAVITGRGTNGVWREGHAKNEFDPPSKMPDWLVTDIRRLMRHALKELGCGRPFNN